MSKKICIKCKKSLNIINFCNNKLNKDGLSIYCKVCQKEYETCHIGKYMTIKERERKENEYIAKQHRLWFIDDQESVFI